MKDELEKRVRIPYEYIVIGKELMSKVIALRVSIDQPWTLDRDITKLSLLLAVRNCYFTKIWKKIAFSACLVILSALI